LTAIANQFSDDEMEAVRRNGQALGGGPTDFEEEVERHLTGEHAREREAAKMRAAESGDGGEGLGPEQEEQMLAKQAHTLQQHAEARGAVQAQQISPTPTGSQGVSQPYPAQAGPQPPPAPEEQQS